MLRNRRGAIVRRACGLAFAGLAALGLEGAAAQDLTPRILAAGGVTLSALGPGSLAGATRGPLWARPRELAAPRVSGDTRGVGDGRRGLAGRNAKALWPALLSGLVPGAGQVRNGSLLRGCTYFALEMGSWVAYSAFRNGSQDKMRELRTAADAYWDYERYADGCPSGTWDPTADEEIRELIENGSDRFYEYVTRDAYTCGWDTSLSQSLYRELWDDRDALLSAKRWAARVIFLNHLVAAVDAFVEARSGSLDVGSRTQLHFDLHGLPRQFEPMVRITHWFGGPPSR
jgi:hypothetical protein